MESEEYVNVQGVLFSGVSEKAGVMCGLHNCATDLLHGEQTVQSKWAVSSAEDLLFGKWRMEGKRK